MRFMTRSLLGVALMALTIALVGAGLRTLSVSIATHEAGKTRKAQDRERVYTVKVAPVSVITTQPKILSYGEIESGRSLELRAVRGGALVEIGPQFRDGGLVTAGTLLFATNPADAQSARDLAETELLDAQGEEIDAAVDVELTAAELASAERQLELRTAAELRQRDLVQRGVGTDSALETASLATSSAQQAVVGRRQAIARANARLKRAEIGVKRRQIALAEAERVLADTRLVAPFSGVLSGVSAVEGRLVSPNETLGTLIDATALEVAFRVSTAQYARLISSGKALDQIDFETTLALDGAPVTVSGRLDRVGAEVGDSQTGRLLFGALENVTPGSLLPGDFVSVSITEPQISGVSQVSSEAVNSNARMLLLGDDERLEAVQVTIERRQGNSVIVRGLPEGREYVAIQQPQLGPGVKVKPVRDGQGLQEVAMITLDAERKDRIVKAIEGNAYIPKDRKAQILARLAEDQVPVEMVERIEARMGGGTPASVRVQGQGGDGADGPKIALAPQRREKLRSFVEANQRMPSNVKSRILSQLDEDEVSEALVERLEARTGG